MVYPTIIAVAQAALLAFLLIDRRVERREHSAEREMLLQRIQAPQVAVAQHQVKDLPPDPPPLPYDDDEAYHVSREQMAEALRR